MELLQNMKDVLRTMSHRKPSEIYCPRCGSQIIHLISNLDYWLTPRRYVCEKCGYVGPIIMELEKEEGKS